jgi:hypothetical protein
VLCCIVLYCAVLCCIVLVMSCSSDKKLCVLGGAVVALVLRELFSIWKTKRGNNLLDYSSDSDGDGGGDGGGEKGRIGSEHPYTTLRDKYNDCVYMDYNATTPIWPEVTQVMTVSTLC